GCQRRSRKTQAGSVLLWPLPSLILGQDLSRGVGGVAGRLDDLGVCLFLLFLLRVLVAQRHRDVHLCRTAGDILLGNFVADRGGRAIFLEQQRGDGVVVFQVAQVLPRQRGGRIDGGGTLQADPKQ